MMFSVLPESDVMDVLARNVDTLHVLSDYMFHTRSRLLVWLTGAVGTDYDSTVPGARSNGRNWPVFNDLQGPTESVAIPNRADPGVPLVCAYSLSGSYTSTSSSC